jgi:hypothetical protein
MNVVVRDERSSDAPAIRAVLEAAFSQAVEADLVDKLRAACHDRISLVACDYDRIVGHILFTPAIIDRPEVTVVGYFLAPSPSTATAKSSALAHASMSGPSTALPTARTTAQVSIVISVGTPHGSSRRPITRAWMSTIGARQERPLV